MIHARGSGPNFCRPFHVYNQLRMMKITRHVSQCSLPSLLNVSEQARVRVYFPLPSSDSTRARVLTLLDFSESAVNLASLDAVGLNDSGRL
eukprot:4527613-Pleurochrysis_carterae.AAC.1